MNEAGTPQTKQNRPGLQVLGAGLPRTGTASLKAALEILLGERCYHMYEVFLDAGRGKEWQRIYREIRSGNDSPGFDNVFKGYGAAVDAPASEVWSYILKQYPSVKVILTHRPGKEWKKSMDNTILQVRPLTTPFTRLIALFVQPVYQQFKLSGDYLFPYWDEKYGFPLDESYMTKRIEEVKRGVPQDQLLDYALGSGWEPLCKFLDKPIPDVPFPRVNDKEEFGKFMQAQLTKAIGMWAGLIIATVAVGVKLVW